jgi:hypothetical protein
MRVRRHAEGLGNLAFGLEEWFGLFHKDKISKMDRTNLREGD